MTKTLSISFDLKNTYRVNSILYSLKQVPFLKKVLPDSLYRVRGLKIFANVISLLWEILAVFLGKALYFLFMIAAMGNFYKQADQADLFLHILFCLTIIGSFLNTYMFDPGKDKYYAVILLGMDAREYALVNYGYAILKVLVGFLLMALLFGPGAGVSIWQCLMIPVFVAGAKLTMTAYSLRDYENTGKAVNENIPGKVKWIVLFLLLGAAYLLPKWGIVLPAAVTAVLMTPPVITGIFSIRRIVKFSHYREMYQQILTENRIQMDKAKQAAKVQSQSYISVDPEMSSGKKGFTYLNELFIKRHKKILWRSSKRISCVCLGLIAALLLLLCLKPELRENLNRTLMGSLPYFVFIMYMINRGTGFTRALFMNCDHSLLTYSFYKQPGAILKLFRIRLWEIMKINLLPAAVLGGGLALLFWASGGTEQPVYYVVMVVSVLCMSVFFSVHYLTLYYLLQPYNAGTEMKSGTYQFVLSSTYFFCYLLMNMKLQTLAFGGMTIVFCVVYFMAACFLVYHFAPRTFKLRE